MKSVSKEGWQPAVALGMKDKTPLLRGLFSKMKSSTYGQGKTPIYLNVYDLTPVNGYLYWAGLGIFHSGVEVDGVEYSFGSHEYPVSGVFEVEPRKCPGFKFRKSIFIGTTTLDCNQVREFMEHHSSNYNGNTYHLVFKNCNHFCKDVCYKLAGKSIPKWVNRLAKIGSGFSCLLPDTLKRLHHDHPMCKPYDSDTTSLNSSFSCLTSISMRQRQSSAPSLFLRAF